MSTTPIDPVASQLVNARQQAQPVAGAAGPINDTAHAYAIQQAVAEAMGWPYASARHWKSGGANPDALQTHAPLPEPGVRSSPADLRDMPFQLRCIEVEIALRLGVAVDAKTADALDVNSAADLIDAMCVSIEVVDTRWSEGLQAPDLAKLADLQAHGALVLGQWVDWQARDWSAQRCEVTIGSSPVQTFQGTHSLGGPPAVLPKWLRHACALNGTVAAGTVVTTGTWCGLLHAQAGDQVQASFEGIGQASLQF